MYYSDELYHYGRKGMKWGQHIYGNTSYSHRDAKAVNDIYETLSLDEKRKLNGGDAPAKFTTQEEYSKTLASFILKHKDTPVSAFDVWSEADDKGNYANEAAVSVLTRSGDQYRGKGYATDVVSKGMKWLDENPDITHVYWDVRRDNTASIALAKKFGFTEMEGTTNPEWTAYHKTYKNKRKTSK